MPAPLSETKKAIVLTHLITGKSSQEVAAITGVGRRTIERWRSTDTFKRELGGACNKLLDAAVAEVSLVVQEAAQTLIDILRDPDTRNSDRLRAIQMIFDLLGRSRDWKLESDIEILEVQIEQGIEVQSETITTES